MKFVVRVEPGRGGGDGTHAEICCSRIYEEKDMTVERGEGGERQGGQRITRRR